MSAAAAACHYLGGGELSALTIRLLYAVTGNLKKRRQP